MLPRETRVVQSETDKSSGYSALYNELVKYVEKSGEQPSLKGEPYTLEWYRQFYAQPTNERVLISLYITQIGDGTLPLPNDIELITLFGQVQAAQLNLGALGRITAEKVAREAISVSLLQAIVNSEDSHISDGCINSILDRGDSILRKNLFTLSLNYQVEIPIETRMRFIERILLKAASLEEEISEYAVLIRENEKFFNEVRSILEQSKLSQNLTLRCVFIELWYGESELEKILAVREELSDDKKQTIYTAVAHGIVRLSSNRLVFILLEKLHTFLRLSSASSVLDKVKNQPMINVLRAGGSLPDAVLAAWAAKHNICTSQSDSLSREELQNENHKYEVFMVLAYLREIRRDLAAVLPKIEYSSGLRPTIKSEGGIEVNRFNNAFPALETALKALLLTIQEELKALGFTYSPPAFFVQFMPDLGGMTPEEQIAAVNDVSNWEVHLSLQPNSFRYVTLTEELKEAAAASRREVLK